MEEIVDYLTMRIREIQSVQRVIEFLALDTSAADLARIRSRTACGLEAKDFFRLVYRGADRSGGGPPPGRFPPHRGPGAGQGVAGPVLTCSGPTEKGLATIRPSYSCPSFMSSEYRRAQPES